MASIRFFKKTKDRYSYFSNYDLLYAMLYGFGPFLGKPLLNENASDEEQINFVKKFLKVRDVLKRAQLNFVNDYPDRIRDIYQDPLAKHFSKYKLTDKEIRQENEAKKMVKMFLKMLEDNNEKIECISSDTEDSKEYTKDLIENKKGRIDNFSDIDDIKLTKIKIMLEDTAKYLSNSRLYIVLPFILPVKNIGRYYNNKVIKLIFSLFFKSNDFNKNLSNSLDLMELRNADEYLVSADAFIGEKVVNGKTVRGLTVFWALLLLSVDDKFYENEKEMISKLAYMLNFNPEMLDDWSMAVKYLLDGNRFNEDISVAFKSKEANKFFKHK